MTRVNDKSVTLNLRALLNLNETELPKYQIMDAQLWLAVKKALSADSYMKELDWLDLGPALSESLRTAPAEVIGRLAEPAVCSFTARISEKNFLANFGRQEDWTSLQKEARISYYRARFASVYWCSVRDYAVKSKSDCLSLFHLPMSIIAAVAESTTSQIIDFCHGYPGLQRFGLSCDREDCMRVIQCMQDQNGTLGSDLRLLRARLLKSNRCASFIHTF